MHKVQWSYIYILIAIPCFAQQKGNDFTPLHIDASLERPLFSTQEYMLNPLTLYTETGQYDNVEDSTRYWVTAKLHVNDDSLRTLHFASAKQIAKDTIQLMFEETNPTIHQELEVTIADKKCTMTYTFSTPGPITDPKVKRMQHEVTLQSFPEKKGDTIYGTLFFKGSCISDCQGDIEIKGDFKAVLE